MKLFKTLFFITLVITQISCVKVLDYEIPDDEKKIVINGLISSDDTFSVYLNKSMHILDRINVKYLYDAQIQLYTGDLLITEINSSPSGKYVSDVQLKDGDEYTIIVNSPGLKQVTAKTIIPLPVAIIKADTATFPLQGYYNSPGSRSLKCDITFIDPPEIENYYELKCYANYRGDFIEWISPDSVKTIKKHFRYNLVVRTNDPIIEQWIVDKTFNSERLENGYGYGESLIFSDKLIEGKEHLISIELYPPFLVNPENSDSSSIDIQLQSVSKDYYLYMQVLEKHMGVRNDPLSEPVLAYSNVENGLGLFAAFSRSSVHIPFDSVSSKK